MRLLGSFSQQEARPFSTALQMRGIEHRLEETSQGCQIWVVEEDAWLEAQSVLRAFSAGTLELPSASQNSLQNQQFAKESSQFSSNVSDSDLVKLEKTRNRSETKKNTCSMSEESHSSVDCGVPIARVTYTPVLTYLILIACVILYSFTASSPKGPFFSPLYRALLFDNPFGLSAKPVVPFFRGYFNWFIANWFNDDASSLLGPMFVKLRQGEVWRLITPIFLHASFTHLLFNMMWVILLSKMIEVRLGSLSLLGLTLILALVSNVAQYLMGGPFFVGYSGVVMGLAMFIWMRNRKAPWEGYPLHGSTVGLLMLFVLLMLVIDMLLLLGLIPTNTFLGPPQVANTAHIVGAASGALLGLTSWFAWRVKKE